MLLTREEVITSLAAEYGHLAFYDLNKGICYNCGHIQVGIEPDPSCCEECRKNTVSHFGIEKTIITMP